MSITLDGTTGVTTPGLSSTGTITPGQTTGIVGTTTNNNAQAGSVGEFVSSSVTSVTAGTTATDITSISLTAGDWDITISVNSAGVPATSPAFRIGLNTTSVTFPSDSQESCFCWQDVTVGVMAGTIPNMRKSIAATTTFYLIGQSYTTANTAVQGRLSARRRR